ncbi:hypothetical protein PSYJA_46771, partial [Pseudomonas syringae pv. japonica str. M301072]
NAGRVANCGTDNTTCRLRPRAVSVCRNDELGSLL